MIREWSKARLSCGLLVAFGLLALVAFGVVFDNGPPDYRYRLTVEVDTPDGLRSGSSVIEVRRNMGRSAGAAFAEIVMTRVRGEAVVVELPNGQSLFALLRSKDSVDWASYVMPRLAPKIEGEKGRERLDNVLLIEGKVELPEQWPSRFRVDRLSGYPRLVTFANLDDPTTVARVDPKALDASFGEGVSLRRITVELTDDPVSAQIDEILPWLEGTQGPLVYLPVREYPEPGTPLPLYNSLTSWNFKSGE